MINTKPYVLNTKKSHPWKKLTFDMLPFGLGGTCLELPMWVPFKNSTTGEASGTFICDNREVSC